MKTERQLDDLERKLRDIVNSTSPIFYYEKIVPIISNLMK